MKFKHSFYLLALLLLVVAITSPSKAFSAMDHIVINEVQISSTSASDDFIELYNPTATDINLADYRIVKRTASGVTDSSVKAFSNTDIIPAGGYYLWSNSDYTDIPVTPDASTSATIAANNGVALRNGDLDTGVMVDSVAWGTATNAFVEGSVFPSSPESGQSIVRSDDTDDNSTDFSISTSPDPQNSLTPVSSPSPSPSPTPTPTATPEPTLTPTPTASPTPEPTISPSPTPTAQPTVEPTSTPEPTASPTPRRSRVLARFGTRVCRLEYRLVSFGFFRGFFPKVVCTHLGS